MQNAFIWDYKRKGDALSIPAKYLEIGFNLSDKNLHFTLTLVMRQSIAVGGHSGERRGCGSESRWAGTQGRGEAAV